MKYIVNLGTFTAGARSRRQAIRLIDFYLHPFKRNRTLTMSLSLKDGAVKYWYGGNMLASFRRLE